MVAGDEVLQLLLVGGVQHDLVADELQRGTFRPDHRRHRAPRPVIQPRDVSVGVRDRGVDADLRSLDCPSSSHPASVKATVNRTQRETWIGICGACGFPGIEIASVASYPNGRDRG